MTAFTARRRSAKVRLNLELSATMDQLLSELVRRTGAVSRTQVLQHALALLDTVMSAKERGHRIVVRDPLGNEEQIVLLVPGQR